MVLVFGNDLCECGGVVLGVIIIFWVFLSFGFWCLEYNGYIISICWSCFVRDLD